MSRDLRQMLELAAKAAGLTVQRSRLDDPMCRDFLMDGSSPRNLGQKSYPWNPRDDDGDSHRLAVKLRITINQSWRTKVQVEWFEGYVGKHLHIDCLDNTEEQRADATRLAVLRAAVYIAEPVQ